jgi:hypothetical protein
VVQFVGRGKGGGHTLDNGVILLHYLHSQMNHRKT